MSTQGERLARIETKVDNLTDLLEGHISQGCADNDCKLNDTVVRLQNNVKWMARVGMVVTGFIMWVSRTALAEQLKRIF